MKILLYTPYLQGFFFGEIVSQIRQLCQIKNYSITLVRTNSFGEFNSDISIAGVDGVIVIRNAISPEFIEKLESINLPCVSVAYDYFPLDVPLISSNHGRGIDLAMGEFEKAGVKKIAFVGDISHYDIRKRYEKFCEQVEQRGLSLDDSYIYSIDNTLLDGGERAAEQYLERECDSEGILFASGLTAIGFIQRLKRLKRFDASKKYICFDAMPLIPVVAPELVSIDPNLHLVAYRAINEIEKLKQGVRDERQVYIEPKITQIQESDSQDFDPFLATCSELSEFYSPAYMKSLIANLNDWPREIAKNNLESIMSLATIFPNYMTYGALSRYHTDQKKVNWLKTLNVFQPDKIEQFKTDDIAGICKAEQFYPGLHVLLPDEGIGITVHFPIIVFGKIWGYLSMYGASRLQTRNSSFYAFSGYFDEIVQLYEKDLTIKLLQAKLKNQMGNKSMDQSLESVKETQESMSVKVVWDAINRLTTWSDEALIAFGFSSDVERNIYKHMDISDRIVDSDLESLRASIYTASKDLCEIKNSFQMQLKNGIKEVIVVDIKPMIENDILKELIFHLHHNGQGQEVI